MSSESSRWRTGGHLLRASSRSLPSEAVYVLTSSSHEDTSHILLGPSLMTSFKLDPFKDSVSNAVTS